MGAGLLALFFNLNIVQPVDGSILPIQLTLVLESLYRAHNSNNNTQGPYQQRRVGGNSSTSFHNHQQQRGR